MRNDAKTAWGLLTVKETARAVGQHPATVYRKIHEGTIPAVRLGGGRSALRVPAAALSSWLYDVDPEILSAPRPEDEAEAVLSRPSRPSGGEA